jgi:hypothetical protein
LFLAEGFIRLIGTIPLFMLVPAMVTSKFIILMPEARMIDSYLTNELMGML